MRAGRPPVTLGDMNLTFATTVAAEQADRIWAIPASIVLIIAVLAPLIFFVVAFFSILGSDQGGGMKLVWIVFAFCAPFLGPLLWFLIGRKQSVRT